MSDLIDRQEAIKTLNMFGAEHNAIAVIRGLPSAQQNACEYWDDESDFCALHRPSAQRKGKWIKMMPDCSNVYIQFCSECNKYLPWHSLGWTPDYCPNCGAKMERSEDE